MLGFGCWVLGIRFWVLGKPITYHPNRGGERQVGYGKVFRENSCKIDKKGG